MFGKFLSFSGAGNDQTDAWKGVPVCRIFCGPFDHDRILYRADNSEIGASTFEMDDGSCWQIHNFSPMEGFNGESN